MIFFLFFFFFLPAPCIFLPVSIPMCMLKPVGNRTPPPSMTPISTSPVPPISQSPHSNDDSRQLSPTSANESSIIDPVAGSKLPGAKKSSTSNKVIFRSSLYFHRIHQEQIHFWWLNSWPLLGCPKIERIPLKLKILERNLHLFIN